MSISKIEVYNKIVKLTHKTGQGLPLLLQSFTEDWLTALYELVDDGLLQKVKTTYSTLPDDYTFCLTKGYIVEKDKETRNKFAYIRHYLGIKNEIMPGIKISVKDFLEENEDAWITWKNDDKLSEISSKDNFLKTCKDIQDDYYKWIMKNQHEINVLMKIKYIDDEQRVLTSDEKEWIKTREWFNENLSMKKLTEKIYDSGIEHLKSKKRIVKIYEEILSLDHNHEQANNEIDAAKEDVKKQIEENKLRDFIIKELKNGKTLKDLTDE